MIRAIRSPCVPSLLWKVTWSSFAEHRVKQGAEVVPPEELGVGEAGGEDAGVAGEDGLAVVGGLAVGDDEVGGERKVAGSRSEKNFWFSRIEVCSTSGGRSRKRASMWPRSVTGHSVRPVFSARRPSSSTSSRAGGEGELDRVVVDPPDPGAGGGRGGRRRALSLAGVVFEGGDGEGLGGVEAVAAGRVAGGQAVDLRAAPPQCRRGGRGCRGSRAAGGPSAGCRRPSASTSARGRRGRRPRRSRRRSRRRGGRGGR